MIEGERVYLRPLTEDDLPKVLAWNLDQELSEYLDSELPVTPAECQQWFAQLKSDRYAQVFGIVLYHNHLLIGDVELINITWRNGHAELRIRIGEKDYWDQGLGTETLRLLLGYAFHQLKLERIYLRVYATNRRAIQCYRKAGFSFEGKLKRSRHLPDGHDTIILMHILREEFLELEKAWRKELSRQVG
ncbi:MAG: GNAT family N-acetyltransferase [Firmicutes bacterium]|nr:GNAT family N-acetyltransferase [Bacillota bacterium]